MTGELAYPIATIRDDVTAKTHVENPSTVGRAVGMRKQRLVMGAFAFVEQSPGTGRPLNA